MKKILFLFAILSPIIGLSQNKVIDGFVVPYTDEAKILTTTGEYPKKAIDQNISTFWTSDYLIPDKYLTQQQNCFLSGSRSRIISENGYAFDGNLNTSQRFNYQVWKGKYGVALDFKKPSKIVFISIKANTSDPLNIDFMKGGEVIESFIINKEDNYQLKNLELTTKETFTSIQLFSNTAFDIFEFAGLKSNPEVDFVIDFQEVKEIGQIYSRHLNNENVLSIKLFASNNNQDWIEIGNLNPKTVSVFPLILKNSVQARFLKYVFELEPVPYQKSALWETMVYDKNGPYGKSPSFVKSQAKLIDRIGLNTIWGWGFNVYSDQIAKGYGTDFFNKTFKIIRLYHNLNWDIESPEQFPNFDMMVEGKGTTANWWLNWNKEYSFLKNKGFDVNTTILFKNSTFPASGWHNPEKNAFDFGYAFAKHFGKTKGYDLNSSVEFGNEPWDYPSGFYKKISIKMLEGAKQADPSLTVLPAAFQGTFKKFQFNDLNNYIFDYIDKKDLNKWDVLNTHLYSHTFAENSNRISVMPEDLRSDIHGIKNMVALARSLSPQSKVWVTEFGYDSGGGNEDCTHSECVSEQQQAAWGLRAALFLLRNGAEKVYWYFFMNENGASSLFSRSGLISSGVSKYIPKQSYHAFNQFLSNFGNTFLESIIVEDFENNVFCYQLNDSKNNKKYAIAWIANENPDDSDYVFLPIEYKNNLNFILDGKNDHSWTAFQTKDNKVKLSGYPAIFELKQ